MHKKPIRILRIIARLNVGGPAIQAIRLSKALSKDDFNTLLVCGPVGPEEGDMAYLAEKEGVRPLFLPELGRELSAFNDLKAFLKLRRIIREYKPQIIHTHTAKAGTLGRLAALGTHWSVSPRKRIKRVHTFHGHVFHGYFSATKTRVFLLIERILARITHAIVAISDSQQLELAGKYRISAPARIRRIDLGFDLTPFLGCRQARGRWRRKLGVDEQTVLIGIVGRLVPIKNHRLFFKAAKRLVGKGPERKIRFMVVGDGELRQELEAECRSLGLGESVLFSGWEKDLASIYADLDILVLSSINEGTPVSLIEGMASSVPVVATDAGGVKDLLGEALDGEKGFRVCQRGILCNQNDSDQFANAMEYQLNSSQEERRERLRAARDFVVRKYCDERLVRDIKALYLELLSAD